MTYACVFIHEHNTTKLILIVNSNTCFVFLWKDVYCRLYSTLLHCTEYTELKSFKFHLDLVSREMHPHSVVMYF